jgi:hypothetical protein
MNNGEIRGTAVSRRCMLQNVGIAVTGVAILGATVTSNRAEAKPSQKLVGYQDTPKGDLRCDNCLQFEPPSACKVVEGDVSPAGWCKVYVKKPSK